MIKISNKYFNFIDYNKEMKDNIAARVLVCMPFKPIEFTAPKKDKWEKYP